MQLTRYPRPGRSATPSAHGVFSRFVRQFGFARTMRRSGSACLMVLLVTFVFTSSAYGGQAVFFKGDFDVNNQDRVGRVDFPGAHKFTLPLTGLEGGDEVDGIAVSADGSVLAVFGTDVNGMPPVINLYSLYGGTQTTIYTGAVGNSMIEPAFSPDGAWLAFKADFDLATALAMYVIPVDGSAAPKLVSQVPPGTANDIDEFRWASDSQHIAYVGDPVTNDLRSLWTVDITDVVPAPVAVVPENLLNTVNDIDARLDFDGSDRIYFLSDYASPGSKRIYRSGFGGAGLEQVPGTAIPNNLTIASVTAFGISSDGASVAFCADAPEATLFQVYTMPVASSTPTLVSNVQTIADGNARGPFINVPLVWTDDDTQVAISADWDPGDGSLDNAFGAFVVPATAPAAGVRVFQAAIASTDVNDVAFDETGRLIVRGDLAANNNAELFATADLVTADQDPAAARIVQVPPAGDVDEMVIVNGVATVAPEIQALADVPNDQGRQVRVTWAASGFDFAGSLETITEYALFRRIDPLLVTSPEPDVEMVADDEWNIRYPSIAMPAGWDFISTVPAFGDAIYSVVAPTLADSTINEGIYYSTFFVRALTSVPTTFFESDPDSGYSVDNLEPFAPQNLSAAYNTGSGNQLAWDPAPEADWQYFRVYRDVTPNFVIGQGNLVAGTTSMNWTDPDFDGGLVYYKVTSLDFSGNESAPAMPGTATAIDTRDNTPARSALHANVPNPFNPTTTISYELATAGAVTLRVYDVAGRLVRTLVDDVQTSGRQSIVWNGRDNRGSAVASGIYFYRMTSDGFTGTRSMVLLK